MRAFAALGVLSVGALGLAAGPPAKPAPPERVAEVFSDVYTLDRIYRSMKGPQSAVSFALEPGQPPELLWITGYGADVVNEDGQPGGLTEFMCHSNLDLDPALHASLMASRRGYNPRLFTVSQGQMEVSFPEGFGIPVVSDETFRLTTQVLNLNYASCDLKVRHRTRIRYVRDRDAADPFRALAETAVYGLKLLEGGDGRYGIDPKQAGSEQAASCLPGANADSHEYHDAFNRRFTGHWVVHPGREVNRTSVDAMLQLSEDTVVHAIAVHLHPFAESLELVDATERRSVWKSEAKNSEGRIGLDRVETYSSAEGLPLRRGHRYELVSTYDNTTSEDQDSMAVMYLYVEDRGFDRAKVAALSSSHSMTRSSAQ
jgi:hypothetical protein